jgi:hypothetical protein
VTDRSDACPRSPGDQTNGCPSELRADIRGVWLVNRLFTKLVSFYIRAPVGSRIDVRCRGARGVCPFGRLVVAQTARRTTSLTRYFRKPRIMPSGTTITVRVTKSRRVGTYERLVTRRGRRLPLVTERCISVTGFVFPCA